MNSVPFLDDRYPVRTVYTANADWQGHAEWQYRDARNAALRDYLRTPLKRVLYAPETHSGNVLAVPDENGSFPEPVEDPSALEPSAGCDALVTAAPGILLCIWTADCLPLFLYDPEGNVASIAHCSWKSICSGIVPNTVGAMVERYGVDPGSIVAAFGPGICGKCYEVGDELVEAFSERFSADELDALFAPKRSGKHLLDLRRAVALELCRLGVEPEKIHDIGICSYESKAYPSYRRNGPSELGAQMLSGIVLI